MGAIRQIQWGEHRRPDEDCPYDHVIGKTPIGDYRITWKGWKEDPHDADFDETDWLAIGESPCYVVERDDPDWPKWGDTLDEAKRNAQTHFEAIVRSCLESEEKGQL